MLKQFSVQVVTHPCFPALIGRGRITRGRAFALPLLELPPIHIFKHSQNHNKMVKEDINKKGLFEAG
jgi:hypothetical protein